MFLILQRSQYLFAFPLKCFMSPCVLLSPSFQGRERGRRIKVTAQPGFCAVWVWRVGVGFCGSGGGGFLCLFFRWFVFGVGWLVWGFCLVLLWFGLFFFLLSFLIPTKCVKIICYLLQLCLSEYCFWNRPVSANKFLQPKWLVNLVGTKTTWKGLTGWRRKVFPPVTRAVWWTWTISTTRHLSPSRAAGGFDSSFLRCRPRYCGFSSSGMLGFHELKNLVPSLLCVSSGGVSQCCCCPYTFLRLYTPRTRAACSALGPGQPALPIRYLAVSFPPGKREQYHPSFPCLICLRKPKVPAAGN